MYGPVGGPLSSSYPSSTISATGGTAVPPALPILPVPAASLALGEPGAPETLRRLDGLAPALALTDPRGWSEGEVGSGGVAAAALLRELMAGPAPADSIAPLVLGREGRAWGWGCPPGRLVRGWMMECRARGGTGVVAGTIAGMAPGCCCGCG